MYKIFGSVELFGNPVSSFYDISYGFSSLSTEVRYPRLEPISAYLLHVPDMSVHVLHISIGQSHIRKFGTMYVDFGWS